MYTSQFLLFCHPEIGGAVMCNSRLWTKCDDYNTGMLQYIRTKEKITWTKFQNYYGAVVSILYPEILALTTVFLLVIAGLTTWSSLSKASMWSQRKDANLSGYLRDFKETKQKIAPTLIKQNYLFKYVFLYKKRKINASICKNNWSFYYKTSSKPDWNICFLNLCRAW